MPEVYEDIKEVSPSQTSDISGTISKLLEYTEDRNNPWRADWERIVRECYDFKELRQWDGMDVAKLQEYGVPEVPVDEINRNLDVINGIRSNTGNKRKIVRRESGDERIAEVYDKAADYVEYNSNLPMYQEQAFKNLVDIGVGITKFGWDKSLSGGEGDVFFENVDPEDCGWSFTRKPDWSDLRWCWHHMTIGWEDAARLAPERAAELKGMRDQLGTKWDELSQGKQGTYLKDYEGSFTEGGYVYPNSVNVWEIWLKRFIPYKKVASIQTVVGPDGTPAIIPQVNKVPHDYVVNEGEQEVGVGFDEIWYQHLIAGGKSKKNCILLTPPEGLASKYPFPPLAPMIAEYKKSGMPRGVIEIGIPHQKRINLAWAQKMAFNNKSIKSPLVIKNLDPATLQNKIQQTSFGAVLALTAQEELVQANLQPGVNLQAIEEGNIARQDMMFAMSASEPALRGMASSGDSGIKIAKQQDAAITPLNKWVKAEADYITNLWRKVLYIMILEYTPQRLARIIGEQRFVELLIGKRDMMTGQPIQPPLQLQQPDATQYDVVVQEKSVSDFKKMQAFNSAVTIAQMYPLDAEYVIMHAPIENPEEAYASHLKAKADIMNQLMMENQLLREQLKIASKGEGGNNSQSESNKGKKVQPKNASQGRNASQAGQGMNLGGMLMAKGATT